MDIHQKLEDIEDLLRRAEYETRKLMDKTKKSVLINNVKDMYAAIIDAQNYQQIIEDTLHDLEYELEKK